ncbi:high frequency lysogenization protein HflD [Aliikangiella marina]|uniref:High frequency lysogenization protein HflD homolog n=1 Tax=Aliikangiella marina TaxID=1712262 RepID=A0A545TI85_9GAMM|nr:high frequency lysogenization protein HflD [Aliikangiella marina]TQV76923.1 high frequency lysogenization protein HflD [Aliikangiella marina]
MEIKSQVVDQVIALAGLAQAVRVVQHLAWKGQTNPTDFKAVVSSLLRIEASSAAAVYDGSFEVSSGLRIISHQIDPNHQDKDPEFVNMVIHVMALQQQFNKNKRLMDILTSQISELSLEYGDFEFYNDDSKFEKLLEHCSSAYKLTLSKLSNRIQVKGDPKYLKQPHIQAQVRAALLAAIRACFLWRQSGGSRWHFLFKKKDLLNTAKYLLNNPIRE